MGTYIPEEIGQEDRATPMVNTAHHLVHGSSKDEGERKAGREGGLWG